jgi:hypothetical protein
MQDARIKGIHTFRSGKMNDIAVLLEHVHFLDGLNWLNIELLERCLKLFVVCASALVDLLCFPSWCAFSSV